jgi:AI-2 transport protein TqsA
MSPPPSYGGPWPATRGLTILIGLGAAALAIDLLHSAGSIVGPAFFALVLTIVVQPLREMVTRRGWPNWSGVVVGAAAAYAILVGLTGAVLFSIAKFATLLPQYKSDLNDAVATGTEKLTELGIGQSQIDSISGSFDAGKLAGAAGDVLDNLLGLTSALTIVILLLLFLAADAGDYTRKLASGPRSPAGLGPALQSFGHGTRQYFVVSTVFGFIVAALDTAFLAFTPVPAPLLWGTLAFITNYIPNIGFIIGLVPPAVLGLLEGGPRLMLLIIVVYIVLNFILQSVIQPKFVGDAVGLSVTMTFLSLVFWAWVLGPVGAFLAVPLSLLTKALLIDSGRDSAVPAPLLSSGPLPADGAAPDA